MRFYAPAPVRAKRVPPAQGAPLAPARIRSGSPSFTSFQKRFPMLLLFSNFPMTKQRVSLAKLSRQSAAASAAIFLRREARIIVCLRKIFLCCFPGNCKQFSIDLYHFISSCFPYQNFQRVPSSVLDKKTESFFGSFPLRIYLYSGIPTLALSKSGYRSKVIPSSQPVIQAPVCLIVECIIHGL